jgi:hypothetical protein
MEKTEEEMQGAKAGYLAPGQTILVKFSTGDVRHTQYPKGIIGHILQTNQDNTRMKVSYTNPEGLQDTVMVSNEESKKEVAQWEPLDSKGSGQ